MEDEKIMILKHDILDCSKRLELVQALILNRMDIYSTGVYSDRVCLSDEFLELSVKILDSLANDLNLLIENL